jgi:hypothetical protein
MKAAILCAVLLLIGCSTHTANVRDAGEGKHSVTASANWGGYTGSREEAIAQANEFCRESRQSVAIDSFADQPGVGPKGEQTSSMVFTCITRPPLQLR